MESCPLPNKSQLVYVCVYGLRLFTARHFPKSAVVGIQFSLTGYGFNTKSTHSLGRTQLTLFPNDGVHLFWRRHSKSFKGFNGMLSMLLGDLGVIESHCTTLDN